MARLFSFALLLGLAASMPIPCHAQAGKKPVVPDVPLAQPEDYAQLLQQKEAIGKLMAIDPKLDPALMTKPMLTIRLETQLSEPNPNYKPPKTAQPANDAANQKIYQHLLDEQNRALQMKNAVKRQQLFDKVQAGMANLQQKMQAEQAQQANGPPMDVQPNNLPFIQVTKVRDFQLEILNDVVVRRLKIAAQYDDKGFLQEPTKEQLDELHLKDNKDGSRPGYPAKYDDVKPGQKIVVSLIVPKPAKASTPDKTGKLPSLRLDKPAVYAVGDPIKVTVRFPDDMVLPTDPAKPGDAPHVKLAVEYWPEGKTDPELKTINLTRVDKSKTDFEGVEPKARAGKYRFWLFSPDVAKLKPGTDRPSAETTVAASPALAALANLGDPKSATPDPSTAPTRPSVSMIVIVEDAPATADVPAKKKKNNK